jgi:hypothetical protein
MSIRPLDILDLPIIARYRNTALTLDSVRALTRGHPLGRAGVLTYFNPARHLYSAIVNGDGGRVLGGIIHRRGDTFAKLLYLAPASQLDHPELPELIEHLAEEAGRWGIFHVIAELDETSLAFTALRRAGFSVYAWQRMWDVSNITEAGSGSDWKRVKSVDLHSIQSLYHQIVPPLMHPVEPAPNRATGFVCANGLKCYASVTSGSQGILLTPLMHPEVTDVGERLAALVNGLSDRRGRHVYMCVRSYQTWLEPALEDLGALAAARQAVMVKRLTRLVQEEQTVPAVPSSVRVQPSQVRRIGADKS